jgi:hypothetical protein
MSHHCLSPVIRQPTECVRFQVVVWDVHHQITIFDIAARVKNLIRSLSFLRCRLLI